MASAIFLRDRPRDEHAVRVARRGTNWMHEAAEVPADGVSTLESASQALQPAALTCAVRRASEKLLQLGVEGRAGNFGRTRCRALKQVAALRAASW
jgi:hypothetical protein